LPGRRPAFRITLLAVTTFALGGVSARWFGADQNASEDATLTAFRAEIIRTLRAVSGSRTPAPAGTSGLSGGDPSAVDPVGRAALVEEIKRELTTEMGLVPVRLIRDRRESFVEMYTYDNQGGSSYGTAGYLGGGYFITVKHGVVALGKGDAGPEARRITSIKLMHRQQAIRATLVDAGDAEVEVAPGDWAILKATEPVDLPALRVDLSYGFAFADPIFRLGNDYSKGIIVATGYVGQRTQNQLVTCLTDGHPGVSGGGVLDQRGNLVGIPVGRMQGDFRFSFILPLRSEMFRKVPPPVPDSQR
jgi:hypothetical protein